MTYNQTITAMVVAVAFAIGTMVVSFAAFAEGELAPIPQIGPTEVYHNEAFPRDIMLQATEVVPQHVQVCKNVDEVHAMLLADGYVLVRSITFDGVELVNLWIAMPPKFSGAPIYFVLSYTLENGAASCYRASGVVVDKRMVGQVS